MEVMKYLMNDLGTPEWSKKFNFHYSSFRGSKNFQNSLLKGISETTGSWKIEWKKISWSNFILLE